MNKIGLFISVILTTNVCPKETKNETLFYDPGILLSKIFNQNIALTARQSGYGFIRFEDQENQQFDQNNAAEYGLINLEDQSSNRPLYNEDPYNILTGISTHTNVGHVAFQDDASQEPGLKKHKKRRRRRKPKNGEMPTYTGSEYLVKPVYSGLPQIGLASNPYVNPGFQSGQFNKRPRRPKSSLASEALTAVSGALSSIALYDDYQCVPRLLCEAAGGGTLGSNGVLQSVASIQPLLTLLSAYNGISSSPLFVFGRAVFLGMTSKGNTGTCRYAYPQCPTNPEQLIHYLNNHNGGFFRFFNSPQLSNQQNVEQFYNQLAEQNYGFHRPVSSGQETYGFYPNNQNDFGYGQRPNLYSDQQSYGSNYAYEQNTSFGNRIRFKTNENNYNIYRIQKRIQTKPSTSFVDSFDDDNHKTKWLFPEDLNADSNEVNNSIRVSKALKFPSVGRPVDDVQGDIRRGKSILFPDYQNNGQYYTNSKIYQTTTPVSANDYVFDYTHNFYVKKENLKQNYYNNYNKYNYNKHNNNFVNDEGVNTVYIVRGNGDPNNPEIVKVRPGQTVH